VCIRLLIPKVLFIGVRATPPYVGVASRLIVVAAAVSNWTATSSSLFVPVFAVNVVVEVRLTDAVVAVAAYTFVHALLAVGAAPASLNPKTHEKETRSAKSSNVPLLASGFIPRI
jgi:hypothetical protein